MRIYIIRHAERVHDASFFAPLVINGLIQAESLVEYFENLDITKIYSSPFLRTMQTAYPYSKKHFIKMNLDYAISEKKTTYIIPEYAANITLPLYIAEMFNYNKDYLSIMKTTDIPYPEENEDMAKRVTKFLNSVIDDIENANENILIVTHAGLCQQFLRIVDKYGEIKPDKKMIEEYKKGQPDLYKQGQISLIYDTNPTTNQTSSPFIFKKIN
jgi:broad specificity phosphatase PhoE